MKHRLLSLVLFWMATTVAWAQPNPANVQPISVVRAGTPTSGTGTGTRYTIRALVLNGPEMGGIRYLQDASGNMAIFKTSWSPQINRGDSVLVVGRLTTFNQLVQLDQINTGDYTILNSNNPLPTPQDITFDGFGLSNEAKLVRLQNVRFVQTGSFTAANNYQLSNEADETREMRVSNSASDLDGSPIPQGTLSEVVGIMSRFNSTFQFLPRDLADLGLEGPLFQNVPFATNLSTTGFTVNFSTKNNGNTRVRYGLTPDLEATGSLFEFNTPRTTHTAALTGLQPGQVYYVQCFSVDANNDTSFAGLQTMATVSNSTGSIRAYFSRSVETSFANNANNHAVYSTPNGIRDTIVNFIASAEQSIDICIYNINNSQIMGAINQAVTNGRTVRVVGNGDIVDDNWNFLTPTQKVRRPTGEGNPGIMHHKFIILDAEHTDPNKPKVLIGSSNFTQENLQDANNILIIQDQSLARALKKEFEVLYSGEHGFRKRNLTPRELLIGGKRVQLFISPADKVNDNLLIPEINAATNNIYVNTMINTRNNIANALLAAYNRSNVGGRVWFLSDGNFEDQFALGAFNIIKPTLGNKAQMWDGGRSLATWKIHHKYMVVDEGQSRARVITGSHNWTASANNNNDESTLVIHDGALANQYLQEMRARMWDMNMVATARQSFSDAMAVRLYPNPATTTATLELVPHFSQTASVELLNLRGQVISRQELGRLTQPLSLTMEMDDLPQGLYMVRVAAGDAVYTLRLAKQ